MLSIRLKGDFSITESYLQKAREAVKLGTLDFYGREGVRALESATPKDTGLTSESWYYTIQRGEGYIKFSFHNSNIVKDVPIAIILQYGHSTNNGGWVEGRDYINPAIQPIFDEIVNKLWKEVSKS